MRPELETYHQIDSYLNGKLEGEALHSFEQKLQTETAFAEEVSFQKLTNEIVVGASYDNLRSQMTKDIDKIDAADTTKTWSLYTVAAFILITGVASYYSYSNRKEETKPAPSTEKSKVVVQSSSSEENQIISVTKDSKTVSSQSEAQINASKVQASVTNKIDTQRTAPSATQTTHTIVQDKTTPEIKPVQPTETTTVVDPCLHVQLSAKITASPSCANESTGSIAVHTIAGGTKPYHVSLDQLQASAKTKESYSYLKAETYTVRITDANGCVKTFATVVNEKVCKKNSYVFAPDKGEIWRISGNDNENFTITLINMAGTQVYKSHPMQGEFEWQGIGQQGEYLSAGLYIYVIEYMNGQKENGQVTIVR